jgi:hypothetical protein
MSYEKAMKHSIRKSRKQANNYFGFHTGVEHKETPLQRRFICQCMEVRRWFADRHDGDAQYKRECIRGAIARLRDIRAEFAGVSRGELH